MSYHNVRDGCIYIPIRPTILHKLRVDYVCRVERDRTEAHQEQVGGPRLNGDPHPGTQHLADSALDRQIGPVCRYPIYPIANTERRVD